jgi:hypothetical protein
LTNASQVVGKVDADGSLPHLWYKYSHTSKALENQVLVLKDMIVINVTIVPENRNIKAKLV